MAVIFDCRTTYYTEIPACWEEITVNLGIPVGDYVYKITTPYGRIYQKEVTVSVVDDGFQLASANFPADLFNPWIGLFELRMYETDACTPIVLTICEAVYQSVIIQPVQVVAPLEPILLVCQCPEP